MTTKTKAKAKPRKAKSGSKKKITFYSRSPNQRLVFEGADVVRNERGRVIDNIPAVDVQFENGLFVWDPGQHSQELLDWLRDHPKMNTTREGSFFEKGHAPDEPEPRLADQLDAINEAVSEGDRARIEEVLSTERETHGRDVVLDLGEKSLERMGGAEDASPDDSTA